MSISASIPTNPEVQLNYSALNHRDLSASQLLWRAVLAQAVRDIYSTEMKERLEALRWLKSKDFNTVCDMAEVEPGTMREQLATLATLTPALAAKYGKLLRDKIMEGVHHE